jgi:hypothetical protein
MEVVPGIIWFCLHRNRIKARLSAPPQCRSDGNGCGCSSLAEKVTEAVTNREFTLQTGGMGRAVSQVTEHGSSRPLGS